MAALHDPCPLPGSQKKRSLNERERLVYAPMSGEHRPPARLLAHKPHSHVTITRLSLGRQHAQQRHPSLVQPRLVPGALVCRMGPPTCHPAWLHLPLCPCYPALQMWVGCCLTRM